MIYLQLVILFFLFTVVFQDFKSREISWFLIPGLILSFVWYRLIGSDVKIVAFDVISNLLFVIVQMVLLTLYFSVKNRKLTNVLNNYLGIGDVLFFVVLAFAFTPINFIVFWFISLFASLISWVAISKVSKSKNRLVPLAGLMSACLIIVFSVSILTDKVSVDNDDMLVSSIMSIYGG